MRLSRRTNTIIMWALAIGLLVGMVVMFTPTAGGLFGGGRDTLETPVVIVNNQPITDQQVALTRQNNPAFSAVQEGEVGDDLNLLLIDGLIDRELLRQASAGARVSSAEVRQAVEDWRREAGVAGRQNDQAYLAAIGRLGHTDATFRRAMEEQLRQQRYLENVTEEVAVSDEEVQSFFEANRDAYRSEERIRARQIVTEEAEAAQELHARALEGEDVAALAREHSAVNPERDGAIGAAEASTEPRPVGRAALPTPVGDAAFALRGPGVTEVIESGGRYYLVAVEEYLPAEPRPFEEVEGEVREDALAAKRSAELERALTALREDATIEVPEQTAYAYVNAPVARVGDQEIMAAELARATYGNQQIQQFLTPDNASIISGFFKPTILNQLIEEELAYQGAQELPQTFLGSRQQVASSALNFVSQDVTISDEEIEGYYQANQSRFTEAARATVARASFADEEAALAFRGALLDGETPEDAASAQDGELTELGTVSPNTLNPELDRALFETDAFESLEDGREVSDVLVVSEPAPESDEATTEETAEETAEATAEATAETDALEAETADSEDGDGQAAEADAADAALEAEAATVERYLVLVAERTPERLRPLDEVRDQVQGSIEAEKRAELRQAWLDELRGRIEVEELYTVQSEPQLAFDPLDGLTDEPVDDATEADTEPGDADAPETAAPDTGTAGTAEADGEASDATTDDAAETDDSALETAGVGEAEVDEAQVGDDASDVEVSEGQTLGSVGDADDDEGQD